MSNLSKETIERVEKLAAGKTKAKEKEIKDRFYKHSPNRVAFIDGYETGVIDGATELAERAQVLVDALTEIAESNCDYESTNFAKALHSTECRACKATSALAKYKEVSNG